MILVTGGTGLVGAHLLYRLTVNKQQVRAIYRSEASLEKVKKVFSYYSQDATTLFHTIDWVAADITDIPALEEAFTGITHVYHCAALISFDPKDYYTLKKINVVGTRNLVNISTHNGVQKFCYVSSIATIGKEVGSPTANEESEWNNTHANVYALTKYSAEMEVWRASQEGLKVVMVNPGVILGPGFWEGSGTFFTTAAKGQRYYPPSGSGFVAVTDLVSLMIMSMESDVVNERFITVAKNLSYKEALTSMAIALGKKAPSKQLPLWLLELLWRLDWLATTVTGKKRKLSKNQVYGLREQKLYNNEKSRSTFSFEYSDINTTITEVAKIYAQEH